MSVQENFSPIQNALFNITDYCIEETQKVLKIPKRIHNIIPKWEKFYSVYACDFTKYNTLCKAITDNDFSKVKKLYPDVDIGILTTYTREDFDKIKQLCYVRENGNLIHLGDQRHIYRYKTLNNLKSILVNYMIERPTFHGNSEVMYFENFTYYQERYNPDDYLIEEIELNWVEKLSIKEKISLYIKVLRLCKKGYDLRNAVNKIKKDPE